MYNNAFKIIEKLKSAFTLAEVLIAIAIVGVIAGLVLPTTISRAQNRSFDQAYTRNIQTIEDAVDALIVVENKDFFKTEMYSDTTPSDYDAKSGTFIKKYLKVSMYCGTDARLCFPSTYYRYNGNKKEVYNPTFKGACAKLKNGASICLEPQIGSEPPKGYIDLNGSKGPNVLYRDLKEFFLSEKTKVGAIDKTQNSVAVTIAPNYGGSGPCVDPNSLACCQTKSPVPMSCCLAYPDAFGSYSECTPTPEEIPPSSTKNIKVIAIQRNHSIGHSDSEYNIKIVGLKDGYCVDVEFRVSGWTSTGSMAPFKWNDITKSVCTNTTFSTNYAMHDLGIVKPDVNNNGQIVRLFLKSPEGNVVKSTWCNDAAGASYCTIEYEY